MVFLILNFICCLGMIAYSFAIDKLTNAKKSENTIVNLILMMSALFGLMALTLIFCFFAPAQLSLLFGRFSYMMSAWFCVSSSVYVLTFPDFKKNTVLMIVQWILNIAAAVILFVVPNAFSSIYISPEKSYEVISGTVFPWTFFGQEITWFPLFCFIYYILIPVFAMLMLLVKRENTKSRLDRQRMSVVCVGCFATFLLLGFFNYASKYQTMMRTITMVGFLPELIIFAIAERNTIIWDKKTVFRSVIRFVLGYGIPGIVAGLVFALLWPLYSGFPAAFVAVFLFLLGAIIALWTFVDLKIGSKDFVRDSRYAQDFENDIISLNFEGESWEIALKIQAIFKKYVDSSYMKILVDSGNGKLESLFVQEGETQLSWSMDDEAFDTLLSIPHPIVFREFVEQDVRVIKVREKLLNMLNEAGADAVIILNEGRNIISTVFLGPKLSGNVYNDYDYEIFTKLYSNFFVIGYYMKNIVNASVVGIVDREIRMSSQIITSIQENMDYIKNPKVECGYRMIPAHSIGGEFIDFIRLNDSRHIFIIGALSGKGIAASMSMVIMKSIIRTFLVETSDFKLLVEKVNGFIRNNFPRGTFFSGMFGLLDFSTDTMYYINCGTPALFLYTRAYNNVIEIQGEGRVLGFAKDVRHLVKVKKIKLSPGDIVLSCTDGLVESRSLRGEIYGKDRIQRGLMENSVYPADKMAQFTYEALSQFSSKELEDDVTVLILKYKGEK